MDVIAHSIPEALHNVATTLLHLCENWRKYDNKQSEKLEDGSTKRKVRVLLNNSKLSELVFYFYFLPKLRGFWFQ